MGRSISQDSGVIYSPTVPPAPLLGLLWRNTSAATVAGVPPNITASYNGTSWDSLTTASAARGVFNATASGTFIVPAGVTTLIVSAVAGGGSGGSGGPTGGSGSLWGASGGGGGGAGQSINRNGFTVTPGQSIPYTIGTAGASVLGASVGNGNVGLAGGNTVCAALFGTLTGGSGGQPGLGASGTGPVAGGFGGAGLPSGSDGSDSAYAGNSGAGASSPFGGGGGIRRAGIGGTASGYPGSGFGSGGGGSGGAYGSVPGSSGASGAGRPGLIIFEW